MNNSDAIHRFFEGKAGSSVNVTSDGTSLWSYGWWEMARWMNGEVVVRNGKRFSPTTVKQMSLLERTVKCPRPSKATPSDQARMNV